MQRKVLFSSVAFLVAFALPAIAETPKTQNYLMPIDQLPGVVRHIGDDATDHVVVVPQKAVEAVAPTPPVAPKPLAVVPVVPATAIKDAKVLPAVPAHPLAAAPTIIVAAPTLSKTAIKAAAVPTKTVSQPMAKVTKATATVKQTVKAVAVKAKSVKGKVKAKKVIKASARATSKSMVSKTAAQTVKPAATKVAAATVSATALKSSSTKPVSGNIVETAQSARNFKTLSKLLRLAGLVPMLETQGNYTVFAPNDAAFAHLSAEQIEHLQSPGNREQLVQILSNHIIGGRRLSDAAIANMPISPATMAGQPLSFASVNGLVQVNGVNIVGQSIPCSNGLIHVVDHVLLPEPMVATTPPSIAIVPPPVPTVTTAKNTVKAVAPPASLRDLLEGK
jgi:uncharacterized surface protein with fasciclin (FAS1) repeats